MFLSSKPICPAGPRQSRARAARLLPAAWLAAALLAASTGCVDVSHGEPKTAEVIVKTDPKVVSRGFVRAKVALDGASLDVDARPTCDLVEVADVEHRTTVDNRMDKGMPGALAAVGVIGGLPLTGGIVMIADSPHVYGRNTNSRTYNPAGRSSELVGGVLLALAGTVTVAVPIVNAARAAGGTTTTTHEPRDGRTLRADVACDGSAATQSFAVTARAASGENATLGTTDARGHLRADLEIALASWLIEPAPPVSAGIFVNGQLAGDVDLTQTVQAFLEHRAKQDESAWSRADAQGCVQQKSESGCAGVKSYLQALPQGRHASEAKTLLGKFLPKPPVVAADDAKDLVARAIASAQSASNLASNKVREKAETDQQKALLKAEDDARRAGKQACQETCKKVCEEPLATNPKTSPVSTQECKTTCVAEACQ